MAKADPGGFVVITQVSPQLNQVDPSQMGRSSKTAPVEQNPLKRFYQGEPKALGVTQIISGIVLILLGVVYDVSTERYPHTVPLYATAVPYWSGILYIISGSLSVAAANNPKIGLVRCSLSFNIISTVASGIAVILYALLYIPRFGMWYWHYSCYEEDRDQCERRVKFFKIQCGIISMLFIFTILELCVSISTSAFGCKTVCRTTFSEVTVVIYQTSSLNPDNPDLRLALPSYKETNTP